MRENKGTDKLTGRERDLIDLFCVGCAPPPPLLLLLLSCEGMEKEYETRGREEGVAL